MYALGMGVVLEYSRVRVGWGPVWVWPSRRTALVMALAVLTGVWVGLRHSAWRDCGEVKREFIAEYNESTTWVDDQLILLTYAVAADGEFSP